MSTIDNNPITSYKVRSRERQAKNAQKSLRRKLNKEALVLELINDMFNDTYNYEDFMKGLCKEALYKRTQKELKKILYGE